MYDYGTQMAMVPEGSTLPPRVNGLGSACASSTWQWASGSTSSDSGTSGRDLASAARPVARPAFGEHQVLRVPREVLRMMADAAWAVGRSEEEIWIEAAREWLRRRTRDDDPPPTAPAAAWPAVERASRTWAAIDSLVADLRCSGAAANHARAS